MADQRTEGASKVEPSLPVSAKRLAWVVVLRLLFLTLLVGLTGLFYLRSGFSIGSYSNRVLAILFALGCAAAMAVWILLAQKRHAGPLAYFELLFEQVAWTVLIYATGGATSGATAFYGLTSVAGAIVVGPLGVTVAASAGAVFYLLLCFGFVVGIIGVPPDQAKSVYTVEPGQIIYPIFLNLLVLMIVALLAQYLAERLRLTGGRLIEATARAEQAERLAVLGRIAAGLAHEIRNPLGSILGSIQLLSGAEGLGSEGKQLCHIIERETSRLNDLVTDMLQLSRPKEPVLMPVDVGRTVREVVALATQSGRGGDVRVAYDGPGEGEPLMTLADAGQLRQVVWNLMRNAVQASSPGACVRVRVCCEDTAGDNGAFLLEVHDDGPGLDPEAKKRLFDPFFTTRSAGVGIGLAVVKRIVDDHKWRIEVASDERTGATFKVHATAHPRSA